MLDQLSRPESWERFYEYKTSLACPKDIARELRQFIDSQAYLTALSFSSRKRLLI